MHDVCARGDGRHILPLEHHLADELVDREHPAAAAGPHDHPEDEIMLGSKPEPLGHVDHLECVVSKEDDRRPCDVVDAPIGEGQGLLDAVHRQRPRHACRAHDQHVDRLAHWTPPGSQLICPGQSTVPRRDVGRPQPLSSGACRSPTCPSPGSASST